MGFLKGVTILNEKREDTAIREFKEECNILVDEKYLENFFIQENDLKKYRYIFSKLYKY